MPSPNVTYTFANSTTADATEVNTNFTDIINALTDGTKDLHIAALNTEGACTFDGAVTLGDSSGDDLTFNGSLASTIPVKTTATYNFGDSTHGLLSVYLGNSTFTLRLLTATLTETWSLTLPGADPATNGKTAIFSSSGAMEFRYYDKTDTAKTTAFTAAVDYTIYPCTPAASFDVTLPDVATSVGKTFQFYKTDSDLAKIITIKNASAATITKIHTQNERVWITSDGTNWAVSGRHVPSAWTDAGAITIGATTAAPTKASGITVDKLYWRRVGNSAEFRYEYAQSNITSAAAGTGDYLFPIPTGMTIDTSIVAEFSTVIGGAANAYLTNAVGHGQVRGASTNGDITVSVYDTQNVRFYYNTTASNGMVNSANFSTTDNLVSYAAWWSVPITDWNS